MQFKTISLSLLVALAAAQSTPTITAAPGSSTSLAGLVSQLPTCALGCFSTAAKDIGCAASDFSCLCSNSGALVSKLGPCIALSGCSSSDINKAGTLAPQICNAVANNPNPADVASASNIVTSAFASQTSSKSTNAAVPARTMGIMGAAGFAGAVAALAL